MPVTAFIRSITGDDIGASKSREFVGTGPEFVGQTVRIVAITLSTIEGVLIEECKKRKHHEPEHWPEGRQTQQLHCVHTFIFAKSEW